jgi:NADH dehydrogenase
MIQWAWSYLTYERGARLITGSNELPGWTELNSQPSDEDGPGRPVEPKVQRRA